MDPEETTGTTGTTTEAATTSPIIDAAVGAASTAAVTELAMAESKAEQYALSQLFGTVKGGQYYAILTGSGAAQGLIAGQNVKAVSYLEGLFLRYFEPPLFTALHAVGLA